MPNTVTIDMESTIKEITAGLDLLEWMIDRAETCTHPRTIEVMVGRWCMDCEAVLPDSSQE